MVTLTNINKTTATLTNINKSSVTTTYTGGGTPIGLLLALTVAGTPTTTYTVPLTNINKS